MDALPRKAKFAVGETGKRTGNSPGLSRAADWAWTENDPSPDSDAGVSDETQTPAKPKVRREAEPVRALTALRGLAAWWVVVYHFREALPGNTPEWLMQFFGHGYLAVDLFFILSGYVMALNYGKWFSTAPVDFALYRRFLALRLSRIYPLHAFMLALFLLNPLATLLFSSRGERGALHAGYYLLSLGLMQHWGIVAGTWWNVPAWSISTEWFAYLLFPALIMIVSACARRLSPPLFFVPLIVFYSAAVGTISPSGLDFMGQSFGLFRCVMEFSIGLLLCRVEQTYPRSASASLAAIAVASICFALTAILRLDDFVAMPLGFAALIYGLADERGLLPALLRLRALQWLGMVSYSTYMSHYFLKIWSKFLLGRPGLPPLAEFTFYVFAVLAASGLLYHWIEMPSQRWLRSRFIARKAA